MTQEQAQIVASVRAGVSIEDAATQAGRSVASVRRWLTQGRKRGDGDCAEFARAVDAAREARRVEPDDGSMTHAEIERRLTVAIRKGSIPAVRIWLGLHRPEQAAEGDSFSEFDPAPRLRAVGS
jgi:hypothetical protein